MALTKQEAAEIRPRMDGKPCAKKTFAAWLATLDEAAQNELFSKSHLAMWRKGNISLGQLIDDKNRPLTLDQLKEA